jgi:hypothetical protein
MTDECRLSWTDAAKIGRLLMVLLCVTQVTACSGDSTTSTPSAPTTTATTEMFSGTVAIGGADYHPFSVFLSGGQVNVILTAAGPPATIYMGLGLGTYDGAACTLISSGSVVTPAGSVAQLSGTANAGSYCVQVYDVGNQAAAVSYAVTVSHY